MSQSNVIVFVTLGTQATCSSGCPPYQMWLHPDYHRWATGGPPDVATSSGPPDVALEVGTRMLACSCNANAGMKWLSGCTHSVVHRMCTCTCSCPPDVHIHWT